MKAVSFALFFFFATLFQHSYAGDFVGPVMLKYNVFSVFVGDSFTLECSARHEDRRPQLRWYFLNIKNERTNLTDFSSRGKGFVATLPLKVTNADSSDSGDYYCSAKVGEGKSNQKESSGIPIEVIKEENKPRVEITKTRKQSKSILTCKVYPQGNGHLTWRHNGKRVKYAKLASELTLEPKSGGEYQCHGNLTLGGFRYFISTAYVSGASSWYHTTPAAFFASILLSGFIAILSF